MSISGKRVPLAVVAGGVGLIGVVAAHRGAAPMITAAPSPRSNAPATTTAPTGTNAAPPPSTATPGTHSAVGQAEQYGYGVLSVKVTVSGGKITDISVVQLQTAEQYSQSLAEQVIPMLRNEILSAQSTRVNAVSGATYTSEAYAYSVQSALDQLHV